MKDKYLRETRMVDFSNPAIQKLIQNMKWKEMGEFERIKAIYNYVRDDVLFGYNIDDGISASKVLADGYGQCNTKGTLFMALLRACNIPCRVHGFTIDKRLQKGAMTGRLILRDVTSDNKVLVWLMNTLEMPLANICGHGDVQVPTRDVVIKCCKKAGLKVEKFEIRKGIRMHCVVRKPMGKAIGNER